MMRFLRSVILPAMLGLGLLALVGLAGSAVVLVRAARDVHPVLEWVAVALLAAGVSLLIVYPLVRVALLPRGLRRPGETSGPRWERFLTAYGRRLAANDEIRRAYDRRDRLVAVLEGHSRGGEAALETEVEEALRFLDERARDRIARHAAAVFTATAVSRSGRLDALIVLTTQLRLVWEIARLYYQRPALRELIRLYANVGAAVFVAGEIEDSELLAVLGAPVSAGITNLLPIRGTEVLVSLLVNSLLNGSANAFLTLRVGVLARRYCGLRREKDRPLLVRNASVEAAGLLGEVVSQGAKRVAAATRKAAVQGAWKAPKRAAASAARGTGQAAREAVDRGARFVDRFVRSVARAGERAGEVPRELGRRGVEWAASFWEGVAGGSSGGGTAGAVAGGPALPSEESASDRSDHPEGGKTGAKHS